MAKKESMKQETTRVSSIKAKMLENAKKGTIYAGKRFLGFTPKGAEVWISMELDRTSKDLSIRTTHNLDSLLGEDAELTQKRIVVKKGASNSNSIHDLMRRSQKNMGGEITERTITYLKKLISASEMKSGKGYVNGEVTRLLFQYAANAIYEGSFDAEKGDFSWSQVIKTWNLPNGEYFLIDSMPLAESEIN
jgi:hypothetical protein